MDAFVTFHRASSLEESADLIAELRANGIEVELEDASPPVDITFTGNPLQQGVRIKVRQGMYPRARAVLDAWAEAQADAFDEHHYLHDFSDEELKEVLAKWDEWSAEDYAMAQRILRKRGHLVSGALLASLKQQRLEEVRKPEAAEPSWVVAGFLAAVLGGFVGMVMGWFYWTSQKVDPMGRPFYLYDAPTRKQGQYMFWLGLAVFLVLGMAFLVKWMGELGL